MSLEKIVFELRLFENSRDRNRSRKCILWLMESMCQINETYLDAHPEIPSIYKTDVIYKMERGEYWKDVYNIMGDGYGDCEDLSCWRVAELRLAGVKARPYIKWRKVQGSWLYHALVWRPGNRIEDPSLSLGMNRGRIIRKPIFVKP